jgi:6-phospho-beta-glucosidase
VTWIVTVLGGSAVVTPQLAAALADATELAGERIELRLVGRDVAKLEAVVDAATAVVRDGACRVVVSGGADVTAALDGARFVVNQVRAGGLTARAFDERFPQELGLPGEETMGPGGFANAWRTIPVVEELFGLVRRQAPGATLLNLTNPAGIVHQVADRAGLDVITLCDSPVTLARTAAAFAGAAGAEATPGYVGTNHGGWLTSLHIDGSDVLSRALDHADELGERLGFDGELLRRLGAIPNVYLRYVYYPERQLAAQRAKGRVRADELLELESAALAAYRADDAKAVSAQRRAVWYTECVVPMIGALATGGPMVTIAGVTNGGLLPWLPPETMLEVPVSVDNGSLSVLGADPLSVDSQALLLQNAAYEQLTVDAVIARDREAAIRALAANPVVPSFDIAAAAVALIEAEFGALAIRA